MRPISSKFLHMWRNANSTRVAFVPACYQWVCPFLARQNEVVQLDRLRQHFPWSKLQPKRSRKCWENLDEPLRMRWGDPAILGICKISSNGKNRPFPSDPHHRLQNIILGGPTTRCKNGWGSTKPGWLGMGHQQTRSHARDNIRRARSSDFA